MSEPPHVILHGGFHKTATSHIQSKLARNAGHMEKRGVRYVHHRDLRKNFTVPLQANAYDKIGLDWSPKITDGELAALASAFFDPLRQSNTPRIILSDENMAGHCGHCVKRGVLYRWRKKLILGFAEHIPFEVREVHLGLRNYADFFAAAYVEFLRSVREQWFIDEDQMKRQVLENMPNWHGILKTVRTAFPNARIVVWRYEDFGALEPTILQGLCGETVDPAKLRNAKEANTRPTASGRAVEELLRLMAMIGPQEALEQRVALQEEFARSKGFARYDPWTEAERRHLTHTYGRDVARIADDPEFTLLAPENG